MVPTPTPEPDKGHHSESVDEEFKDTRTRSHFNVDRNPNPEMDKLVEPVNELRNLFSSLKRPLELGLPRIVAIGAQSSGKSSTIENFVGRDFLPRGSGLVTRRPLVLHLVNNQGSGDEDEEYGVFMHKDGEKFYDFDDIRDEIVTETDRTTGKKEISDEEIILTLYSRHYVNVSLVDMPGLITTALEDQPDDIVDIIHNLNLKYVKDKNTIILAVSVASDDIENSASMAFVKEYDRKGERTVGVLTKLDKVDEGTEENKKKILLNKVFSLKLDWIGLVNRSQKDINENKTITDARKFEEGYFNNSPFYSEIADRMGSKYLQKYLGKILQQKVKEALPKVKADIVNGLIDIKKKLKLLPNMLKERKDKEIKLNELMIDLNKAFSENVWGVGDVSTTKENAGAKISTIFIDGYKNRLDQVFLDEDIIDRITTAIKNTHAIQKGYFAPNSAVMAVIRSQIDKFSDPSLSCIDDIFQELKGALSKVSNMLEIYPNLWRHVENMSHSKLESLVGNARTAFKGSVKTEKSYINFQHPDFIDFENLAKYVKLGKLEIKDLNKQAMDTDAEIDTDSEEDNILYTTGKSVIYVLATKEQVEIYGSDLTCCFSFMRFDTDKIKEKRSRGEKISRQEIFQISENEEENEITLKSIVFSSFSEGNQIVFKFNNPEERKEWREILVTKSNALVTSEGKQLAHNFMLVISYKNILNTIFLDRLPKIIIEKIVNEMDIFLQKDLPYEMRQLDIEDLMCLSPGDDQKVKDLTTQKECYKAAIKIIEKMHRLGVSK